MNRATQMLRFILDPKPGDVMPCDTWTLSFLSPEHSGTIREVLLREIPKAKSTEWLHVDARMAYLGGPDVVAAIGKHIKQFAKGHREAFAETLARCSHPAVVDVMKAVNNGPAKQWLKAHAI